LLEYIKEIAQIKDNKGKIPKDIYDLISELQTCHIELKMDNEKLHNALEKLNNGTEKSDQIQMDLRNTTEPEQNIRQSGIESGQIIRSVGMVHDITERKQAENVLIKSNERFELLSEAASTLLSSETPESIVEIICRRVMDHLDCQIFFNYLLDEKKQTLHLNAYAGVPEETGNSIEWIDLGVAVCGCVARDSCRIIAENIQETPDERTELVKSFGMKAYACHPIISQGRTIGTLSFGTKSRSHFNEDELELMRTVTDYVATAMERKIREEAITRARDDWEKTFDAVPDLTVILDNEHRVIRANEAMAGRLGVTPEECIGLPCYRAVHGTDEPPSFCPHSQLLKDGSGHTTEVHEDNLGGDFIVSVSPLYDLDGKLIGSVHVARDITKRKKAEEQIKNLLEETQQLNEELGVSNEELRDTTEELQVSNEELRATTEELQLANKELTESEERFRSILDNLQDAYFRSNNEGIIILSNHSAAYIYGFDSPQEIIGLPTDSRYKNRKDRDSMLEELKKHGKIENYEFEALQKDGTIFAASQNVQYYYDDKGEIQGTEALIRDITEQKKAEKLIKELLNQTREFAYELEVSNDELRATTDELNVANEELRNQGENLERLNRTLRALSDSDYAMIHAKNEIEYLNEVCRIIIEDCGHAMVWIGFAEDDENKTVRPVAQYGFDEGYIENLNLTWADTERGRGPTGTAIRTGKPGGCSNMLTDPNFEPWREEAIKRGYASSIVLPLIANNKTLGAISIYSIEPDSFLDDEVKLRAELANDMAFGITNLRLHAEKERAEKELKESEERYRLILETANSGVFLIDSENKVKYHNQRMEEILGYTSNEMLGNKLTQFMDVKGQKNIIKFMDQWKKGSTGLNEFKFIRKDGSTFWTLLAASPIEDNSGKYIGTIGVMTDINARKGVEKALMERERMSKSILYDMMGMINKLMKEESKNEYSETFEDKYEYT
jgi:PAS domain S-box-containing protein